MPDSHNSRDLIVAVTGASGLVGSALSRRLTEEGHRVLRFVRRTPAAADEVCWDPAAGKVDTPQLEGIDAVVHLAGASIAGLWTPAKRKAIRDSRVQGTIALTRALCRLSKPPPTLVCASATGFYGDRGAEVLTESDSGGTGFLAEVCQEWEAAAQPARDAGIRVANARLGIVLAADGGVLPLMLANFRRGLGAVIGDGRQYMSWITLIDAVAGLRHIMLTPALAGPVNLTAPLPVTNAEFTAALLTAVGKRGLPRVPEAMVRLALGQMGRELLLASQRALPVKLLDSGFQFAHPDLAGALTHLLEPQP